jgi:hypothetical protein
MHPIPMMATGTGGGKSDEFKSLPFRTTFKTSVGRGFRGWRILAMIVVC